MSFLVDTNVLSEHHDTKVLAWKLRNQSQLYTSAVCIAELSYGFHRLPAGKKKTELQAWLRNVVVNLGDNILRFDTRVAGVWGELQARLEAAGSKMPARDSYIAATALRHNLTMSTRNVADFQATGLTIVNPWK